MPRSLSFSLLVVCVFVASEVPLPRPVRAELPPLADHAIDFETEIKPLLENRCARCHAHGQRKGGFQIETRESLLKGGESGPAITAGKSAESYLIELVAAVDANNVMPPEGARLTPAEVGRLRAWIDQGLSWEEGFHFPRGPVAAAVAPRHVELPPAGNNASENPIGRLLVPYFAEHDVTPGEIVDDRTFARRAYLDLIGLLPTPDQLAAFANDARADKRAALARELLGDRQRYSDHWITFWNDCLRNDYAGAGYIDGGRKQITPWLHRALFDNLPYDEFVRTLIAPVPESEGFIKGIVWRGVVNASQVPPVQAAQNVSQIFLGINLKCASCHDSFISDWKLTDAYGLAGIFSDEPLEIHRCDNPTGATAPLKFLYPELGTIDPQAPRDERQKQLALALTSPQNGRFARTMVNRMWARLLGHGLVEPVDEMDNPPWNADLLDWLAEDFVAHQYDLKHLLERIVTSRAYQLVSVNRGDDVHADYVFRGPSVRRMSAEQFVDAVSALTGNWRTNPAALPDSLLTPQSAETLKFRSGLISSGEQAVDVDIRGARSLWLIVGDGEHGQTFDWAVWGDPKLHGADGEKALTELQWTYATSGYGKPQIAKNPGNEAVKLGGEELKNSIGTHATSVIVYELPAGTTRFTARIGPDDLATAKSSVGHEMEFFVLTDLEIRAALVAADPLMRALGRQNREQVLTSRPSAATTLEALELTNGVTLDRTLSEGATRWLAEKPSEPRELVDRIFARALNRAPTADERTAALELIGQPVNQQGLEDLLWSLTMLPEFQLIY